MHRQSPHVSFALLAALLIAVASVAPAYAHHGWGGNEDKDSTLVGTVETTVSLSGPHATMQVRVDGKLWDVTLAPPARTEAAGLKEGVIPVGATVTLVGARNKTPGKLEIKTKRVTWNGKLFNVYPEL
jgi:membrane protein implicated in regulation of membrane protease activity